MRNGFGKVKFNLRKHNQLFQKATQSVCEFTQWWEITRMKM